MTLVSLGDGRKGKNLKRGEKIGTLPLGASSHPKKKSGGKGWRELISRAICHSP